MAKESFSDLIKSGKTVLIDFHADWCGPCQMMKPVLKELSKMVDEEEVRIIKIDIDRNPKAAQYYQVQSVPTLMVIKAGKTLWRNSGVMSAGQLKQVLDKVA